MAQGNNKKILNKRVRKGDRGFPIATVAFYGPDDKTATKLVCAIIPYEGAEPDPMKKWFSSSDLRKSEMVLKEVLEFIDENSAKTVGMLEEIVLLAKCCTKKYNKAFKADSQRVAFLL
ncbi:hypothetical protein [Vibrio parahaemolyticus]|uniref:hypothetical protein n=1 Tax=Vibrio parahaemolyticus TaxID=670 RepID=UPI000470DE70|nr:hypothetical protein [Vibrio parahaemolyticus]EHK0751951.1 hypothetical protein [Vibrio parahaemolyticus]EJE4174650.1 hypothetical protein [Vibrio parahaemolyticus]MCR9783831.1 hypothetical protein [Vibrio parahaemolyticus]MDG2850266.1 hypothetical protein [Vibrio parahaemolyticus]MDG3031278.1 hypothetical protein [Vibrio parahaemolyticus]